MGWVVFVVLASDCKQRRHVLQFSFGILFVVVLLDFLFLKLECFLCCLLSKEHNRLFACLGILLFCSSVFSFDFCWLVFPHKEPNPKTLEKEKQKTITKNATQSRKKNLLQLA